MLPINVTRNGAVRPEQDACTSRRCKDTLRLRLDLRTRAAIEYILGQIAESSEQCMLRENPVPLRKRYPLDNRRPVDRLGIVVPVPVELVAVSCIAADVEDIVGTRRIRDAQDLLFPRCEHLLIDRTVCPLADEVLQAEVNARHTRLRDDTVCEFRQIRRDHIERRPHRLLILAYKPCEKGLILGKRARLHELDRRARAEEIVECRDFTAVTARDLLCIGDLSRKEGVIVGKRLHLRELRSRTCLLYDGVRIGEETVRHDLHEVGLCLLDVANLTIQHLLLQLRMRIGIRMDLIVEKVKPESCGYALHCFAIHRIQYQFFFSCCHVILRF